MHQKLIPGLRRQKEARSISIANQLGGVVDNELLPLMAMDQLIV